MGKRNKTYNKPNTNKMYNQIMKKKRDDKLESEALEKGLIIAMTIIFNPLIEDYWKKTASKRIPQLAEQSINLFEAIQQGVVSVEDCISYVEEHTGMKFRADWIKHTGNKDNIENLREKYKEFLKTLEQ